jgi:predicted nucleic-acid-binding protein
LWQLLRAKHLTYVDSDLLVRALSAFGKGKGDFADYVIREHGQQAGCGTIATFDRNLLRETFFSAP